MDFTKLAEPTTVIGLAALAIFSIVYVILQFNKSHKASMARFMELLEKKDENYSRS
jgi:cbb3-type cytochrome oxidase subunit 3